MRVRSLGFRTDLMVLALGGSEIAARENHVVVRTPANPTYWWGNFILFAEPVAAGEVPIRRELFRNELPGAAHMAWGIDSTDGDAGAEDELVAAGFSVGRDTVLTTTELRPPPRPTAATLRPLEGGGDWEQALELRMAWAGGEGVTPEFLAAQVAQARELCERGRAVWYGAFEGDRLRSALGLVTDCRLARYQTIETHPDARRRGLASALVHHAGRAALEQGTRTLVIVADPGYHAIGLYRSLGFDDTETQVQLTRPPSAS